jgi:hypothetical protein
MYPANQAFGAWCVNEGFDMDARDRSDAMWLAGNWAASSYDTKTTLTHPTAIRQAHRDSQASQPPSPDLDISEPANADLERIAKVMPIAKKVNKLAAHAAGTGPEAETAKKYMRKQFCGLIFKAQNTFNSLSKMIARNASQLWAVENTRRVTTRTPRPVLALIRLWVSLKTGIGRFGRPALPINKPPQSDANPIAIFRTLNRAWKSKYPQSDANPSADFSGSSNKHTQSDANPIAIFRTLNRAWKSKYAQSDTTLPPNRPRPFPAPLKPA